MPGGRPWLRCSPWDAVVRDRLAVLDAYPALHPAGGIGRYVRDLIAALRARAAEIARNRKGGNNTQAAARALWALSSSDLVATENLAPFFSSQCEVS